MKILTTLDLAGNQIVNAILELKSTPPANPKQGQQYVNTTDNKLYYYDGSSWIDVTGWLQQAILSVNASNGLSTTGGQNPTLQPVYGDLANTVTEGNDPRLSDSRYPLPHDHGASTINNDSNFPASLLTARDILNDIYDNGLNIRRMIFTASVKALVNIGSPVAIDQVDITQLQICKWLVHVVDQTNGTFYSTEMLAHYTGSGVEYTEFASIGNAAMNFDVILDNGFMKLIGTATADSQSVTVIRTAIKII